MYAECQFEVLTYILMKQNIPTGHLGEWRNIINMSFILEIPLKQSSLSHVSPWKVDPADLVISEFE